MHCCQRRHRRARRKTPAELKKPCVRPPHVLRKDVWFRRIGRAAMPLSAAAIPACRLLPDPQESNTEFSTANVVFLLPTAAAPIAPHADDPMRKILLLLAKIFISGALLFFALRKISFGDLVSRLDAGSIGWIVLAIVIRSG